MPPDELHYFVVVSLSYSGSSLALARLSKVWFVSVLVSFVCVQARLRGQCAQTWNSSVFLVSCYRSVVQVGSWAGWFDRFRPAPCVRAMRNPRGSGIGVGTGAGVQYAGPRASPLACGSQGPQVRARLVHLPGLLSVAAPYRQVVGRGDFVERHACRRFASGPSDRYGFVGCTFVAFDFACSSGSAPPLGSSRLEEELVPVVVALSFMQDFGRAGGLRHVQRLHRLRAQPNGRRTQHE